MLFSLTCWSVAGLRVATFHCGRPKVGGASLLRVQVPIGVRAGHLSIPRAGAAAARALKEENTHDVQSQTARFPALPRPLCGPAALTSRHSPACQLVCSGQSAIWQVWMASGRSKPLQKVSSSFRPRAPTQVTSLVCSPEPQVTEHCGQSSEVRTLGLGKAGERERESNLWLGPTSPPTFTIKSLYTVVNTH